MIDIFNEQDARVFYQLLAHSQETEMRAIQKGEKPIQAFVHNEDEFIAFLKKYNGQRSCYAGIHERKPGCDNAESVIAIRNFFLDIEYEHSADAPATEEQIVQSESIANAVCGWFERNGMRRPIKIFSGNGWHLYAPMPKIGITDANRAEIATKYKTLGDMLAFLFSKNNVRVDQKVFDLARIARIPGTLNTKFAGSERLSRFVTDNIRIEDPRLREYLLGMRSTSASKNNTDYEPCKYDITKVVDISGMMQIAPDIYKGSHPVHGSNSGLNFEVDTNKNIARCWRTGHECTHNTLGWIAVVNGLIECQELKKDLFKGNSELYGSVYELAQKKYGFQLTEKKEKIIEEIILLFCQKKTRSEGIYEMAQFLMKKYHFLTEPKTEEIYTYIDGYYQPAGKQLIKDNSERILGHLVRTHDIAEIVAHIQRSTYCDVFQETQPQLLCLKNGVLDLNTCVLSQHDPDLIFLSQIPVAFDTESDCPTFKQFLSEILQEDDITIIQELIGYTLWRAMPNHKAFLFVGEGANGKSTLINIIKALLGQKNCASIPLQMFENNTFASSGLLGKLVNLYADLPSKAVMDTGYFKALVGGDLVPYERKFQDKSEFVNYAKFIFSANQIPMSFDNSDAYFRRWLIITFPNQFLGAKDKKDYLSNITTANELTGILNWALEGLKRLRNNDWEFSHSKTTEETREEYKHKSDPMGAFFMDKIEEDPVGYVPKDDIYSAFCAYCLNKNYPVCNRDTFFKKIQQYVPSVRTEQKGKKKVRCFVGIHLIKQKEKNDNSQDSQCSQGSPNITRRRSSRIMYEEKNKRYSECLEHSVNIVNTVTGESTSYKSDNQLSQDILSAIKAWNQQTSENMFKSRLDMRFGEAVVNRVLPNLLEKGAIAEVKPGQYRFLRDLIIEEVSGP